MAGKDLNLSHECATRCAYASPQGEEYASSSKEDRKMELQIQHHSKLTEGANLNRSGALNRNGKSLL